MAKIYSSIDEQFVKRLEEEVKPILKSVTLGDGRRSIILVSDIRLYCKLLDAEYKLSVCLDVTKCTELDMKVRVLRDKWHLVHSYYDDKFLYAFNILREFTEKYGRKQLLQDYVFHLWLQTPNGGFKY